MKGKLERRIMLLMGKGNLLPLLSPTQVRDRINQVLGDVLDIADEVREELGKEVYGMATVHDIPQLQRVFEEWFGKRDM